MPVFNWIQARFTDGPNFVSDATDEISRAVAQALGNLPVGRAGCEFGQLNVASSDGMLPCSYLRFTSGTGAVLYAHAVLTVLGNPESTLAAVQRLFEARYGTPADQRVRELVTRLELLPVAQATLPLTDLFVEAAAVESSPSKARRSRDAGRPRRGSSAFPWLLAAAAVGAAGFFAGRPPLAPLAPVSAPPPGLDLEERLARLEVTLEASLDGSEGAAGIPLRAQLAHARQLHEKALAVRDDEIRELNERLVAALANSETAQEAAASQDAGAASETAETTPEVAQPDAPAPRRAKVVASLLSVRSGPGLGYRRLSRLVEGTVVELAGEPEAGWIRIGLPEEGFVSRDFLKLLPAEAKPEVPPSAEPSQQESPAASPAS